MTLWELLFTSKKTVPPHLGGWYFLLPTSLVIIAVLSIRFASSKGYRNFWYWGQLIQLLIINAWYITARLPLSEALPFYQLKTTVILSSNFNYYIEIKSIFQFLFLFSLACLIYRKIW